jgi:hypothetical protein
VDNFERWFGDGPMCHAGLTVDKPVNNFVHNLVHKKENPLDKVGFGRVNPGLIIDDVAGSRPGKSHSNTLPKAESICNPMHPTDPNRQTHQSHMT